MDRTIALRVLTRCSTLDQFVATFRRLSTDRAVFVPTQDQRDVGAEIAFSIRLSDGEVALSGLGSIAARHETAENPFGKHGILIDIERFTGDSEHVFERMRAPASAPERIPEFVASNTSTIAASRVEAAEMLRPTTQMPALFPEPADCDCADEPPDAHDTAEIHSVRPPIATTLGVAPLLPATTPSAPFVVDTPVPWPRATHPGTSPQRAVPAVIATSGSGGMPVALLGAADDRHVRTAMVALPRASGTLQRGPWQSFRAHLARSVRNVRWWVIQLRQLRRRRSTQRMRASQ